MELCRVVTEALEGRFHLMQGVGNEEELYIFLTKSKLNQNLVSSSTKDFKHFNISPNLLYFLSSVGVKS